MEDDLGRLRWRCRRGMKELDLLLRRYVDQHYLSALPPEQSAFRELLEFQDPMIYDLFLGRATPPDGVLASLIERITVGHPNDL